MSIPGHGGCESLSSSSRTVHRDAIFVHLIDLTQGALGCAEDETAGLRYVDLNLCRKLKYVALFVCIFLFCFTIAVIH